MLGPDLLIPEQELASNSNGTGDRDYYFEIAFAGLSDHLYIEFVTKTLTSNGRVALELQHSVTGENWLDQAQSWSVITAAGVVLVVTGTTFANRARLRVRVYGESGSDLKLARVRASVSGKPF